MDPTGATARTPPARAALPRVLWPLLYGNFVIGAGVMVVPGTLVEISADLRISTATAGQLITAGGIVMCLGAPLLAAVVAGWDRRRLLALAMLWYALLHFACALAPGLAALLPLRALALVAPAIFTPQAAACVGLLVPPEDRGRAITFIFVGWSLASVLGMPLGAYVGATLGWRSAFALVGMLSLVSAAWVWQTLPNGVRPGALSRQAWRETFHSPALMTCLSVTLLYSAGQFVLFSYLAPYFRERLGATAGELSVMFMWFGLFGFIGNVLMSRYIDRLGADRAVLLAVGCMAASFVAWPLGTNVWLAALVSIPWALGCFSSNSAQQARLVALAPPLAPASIALNSSGMYAGQAFGAAVGGWMVAHGGLGSLHWLGIAGLLASIGASVAASRLRGRAAATVTPASS